jgi:hypothetical protein
LQINELRWSPCRSASGIALADRRNCVL